MHFIFNCDIISMYCKNNVKTKTNLLLIKYIMNEGLKDYLQKQDLDWDKKTWEAVSCARMFVYDDAQYAELVAKNEIISKKFNCKLITEAEKQEISTEVKSAVKKSIKDWKFNPELFKKEIDKYAYKINQETKTACNDLKDKISNPVEFEKALKEFNEKLTKWNVDNYTWEIAAFKKLYKAVVENYKDSSVVNLKSLESKLNATLRLAQDKRLDKLLKIANSSSDKRNQDKTFIEDVLKSLKLVAKEYPDTNSMANVNLLWNKIAVVASKYEWLKQEIFAKSPEGKIAALKKYTKLPLQCEWWENGAVFTVIDWNTFSIAKSDKSWFDLKVLDSEYLFLEWKKLHVYSLTEADIMWTKKEAYSNFSNYSIWNIWDSVLKIATEYVRKNNDWITKKDIFAQLSKWMDDWDKAGLRNKLDKLPNWDLSNYIEVSMNNWKIETSFNISELKKLWVKPVQFDKKSEQFAVLDKLSLTA